MPTTYDAVVIGAGHNGLTCACYFTRLLVISDRETREQRNRLIEEHRGAVSPQIIADNEATVRAQVLADFAASGVIPTQAEIDAAVGAGLQALIDADVQAYVDGTLATDLEAALPLLKLELPPTHFGKLQKDGILEIEDYDLVYVSARDEYYYRDHYVAATETTTAKRLADKIHGNTRTGVAPTRRLARFREAYMSAHETSPAPWPARQRSNNRKGSANASKCYLRILSGFCGSDDCGCEDQAALATNSCLQRPPKI